jgi:hypothetical protein
VLGTDDETRRSFVDSRLLTSPESLEFLARHERHGSAADAEGRIGGDLANLFQLALGQPVDAGTPIDLLRTAHFATIGGEEVEAIERVPRRRRE